MLYSNIKKIKYLKTKKSILSGYQKKIKKETVRNLNHLQDNLVIFPVQSNYRVLRTQLMESERSFVLYTKLQKLVPTKFLINFPEQISGFIKTIYALKHFRKQVVMAYLSGNFRKHLFLYFTSLIQFKDRLHNYKQFYKFLKSSKNLKKSKKTKSDLVKLLVKSVNTFQTKKLIEKEKKFYLPFISKKTYIFKFLHTNEFNSIKLNKDSKRFLKLVFPKLYSVFYKVYILKSIKSTVLKTLKKILVQLSSTSTIGLSKEDQISFFKTILNLIKDKIKLNLILTKNSLISLIKKLSIKLALKMFLQLSKNNKHNIFTLNVQLPTNSNTLTSSILTRNKFLKKLLPLNVVKQNKLIYTFLDMTTWASGRISNYIQLKHHLPLKVQYTFKKPIVITSFTPLTDSRLSSDHLENFPQLILFQTKSINSQLLKESMFYFFRLWNIKPFSIDVILPLLILRQKLNDFNYIINKIK